jgi:heptose I phosphotransferase
MNLLPFLLVGFISGILLLIVRARAQRAFVRINPRYQTVLLAQGLTRAEDFLGLNAVIISGHPGRNVGRLAIGSLAVFLKREDAVSWRTRLANLLAGFGLVSLSEREATILRTLAHVGVNGPEWVAVGEDCKGRAFLLVRELAGTGELRNWLQRERNLKTRQNLARSLGTAIARIHDAGIDHPDLYAKHVFVDPDSLDISFLDWQRSRRRPLTLDRRAGDLAALNSTLSEEIVSPRERLLCLQSYSAYWGLSGAETRLLLAAVIAHSHRLLRRRHIRDKREPGPTQEWIPVAGSSLFVTPAFGLCTDAPLPAWLTLDGPVTTDGTMLEHQGRRCRLTRSRRHCWRAWLGRRIVCMEEQRAGVLMRLEKSGIAAPRVLAFGCRRGRFGRCQALLLTEAPGNIETLIAWVARTWDDVQRRAVLRRAGRLLRQLHDACCYLPKRAFPFGVLTTAEPVLADAEGVLLTKAPSPSLVGRDLSTAGLLLREGGADSDDVRNFLEGYTIEEAKQVSTPVSERRTEMVASASTSRADMVGAAGDGGKMMSVASPTSVVRVTHASSARSMTSRPAPSAASWWRRLFSRTLRVCQRDDWADFAGADWLERIMGAEITDRFHAKQGRSTCRWILHTSGTDGQPRRLAVYLKRHYKLPWWRGLLATLWPRGNWSPAFAEAEHLERARALGVPVPAVVAAAEYLAPWGNLQSVLAVEELADMLPLHEAVPLAAACLDPLSYRRWKNGLIAEMARLTRLLHDRRLFHKDLYLCHFYVARTDTACVPEWRGRVFLIDLHRLAHHPWTWRLWQMKDLAQLLYSTDVLGIDARDRLRFWREYFGSNGGLAERLLRRAVLFKWRRYRKHNSRRKKAAGP